MSVPVHLTSTYVAGGELEYGRYGNPSWTAFEDTLGALEGGRCVSFASGMAAIAAVFDLVEPGGTIVAPRHSYTGTVAALAEREEHGRAKAVFVDITDTAAVAAACADAAMVWFESPTNPALEVADIPAIVRAAHEHGALVAVDNTFATPLLQRPLEHGADIVVHSATKYISGHSDVLMGAAVTASDELAAALVQRRSLYGAIPAPLEAFLALRGLRTLPVRLERAQATAQELVRRLDGHPALEEVRYPGFGAIVSIVVRGGADARRRARRPHAALGARDEPRRRGVDVRAPSPLAARAADDPRGARAPVGRARARRRPAPRPRGGARLARLTHDRRGRLRAGRARAGRAQRARSSSQSIASGTTSSTDTWPSSSRIQSEAFGSRLSIHDA